MTGEDTEEDLRILRDAKKATHRVFNFETKKTDDVPDHKTRLAAFALSRAYHEGKPVERQITLHGDAEDFGEMLERYRKSDEAMRPLMEVNSLPVIEARLLENHDAVSNSSDVVEASP